MTASTAIAPRPAPDAAAAPGDIADADGMAIADRLHDLVARGKLREAGRAFLGRIEDVVDTGEDVPARIDALAAMCRTFQDAGLSDHGPGLLRRRMQAIAQMLAGCDVAAAGGTVVMAPGAGEALSLALMFRVNGREDVRACALTRTEPPAQVARGLYETVANMRLFPARYLWSRGDRPITVLERLRGIDAAALEAGDLARGVASLGVTLTDSLPAAPAATAALVVSAGVLNALADPQAALARTFALLAPGGVAAHVIDLADPRWARGEGNFGAFSFLLGEAVPRGSNRWRAPAFAAGARAAGFSIVSDVRTTRPLSDAVRARLLPEFAALPIEDVAAVKQHLVLSKPARGQS